MEAKTRSIDSREFVPVPSSHLNKLNTTSCLLLKVDLPKYQRQQTPTSQVDSLKKRVTKSCLPMQVHSFKLFQHPHS